MKRLLLSIAFGTLTAFAVIIVSLLMLASLPASTPAWIGSVFVWAWSWSLPIGKFFFGSIHDEFLGAVPSSLGWYAAFLCQVATYSFISYVVLWWRARQNRLA